MSAFVYFVRAGEHVKIGRARNVDARIDTLQTANAHELELLGTVWGGEGLERGLHFRFAHLNVRGEWFRLGPEILAFIAENCASTGSVPDYGRPSVDADVTLEGVRFLVGRARRLLASSDREVRARAQAILEDISKSLTDDLRGMR